MGIGTSLLLIAAGAVLRFAITVNSHAINLQTIGVILMIVGGVGLVISLFWLVTSAGRSDGLGADAPPPPPRMRDPRL